MKYVRKKTPHVKRVYIRGSGHGMYVGMNDENTPSTSNSYKKIMRLVKEGHVKSDDVKKILKV